MQKLPSPLTRQFWFAPVDARPLALFRIGFGLILTRDWLEWFPDLRALFSSEGIFPHGGPMTEFRWSLFTWGSSPGAVYALWTVGLIALLCFTAGLFTRVATVVTWALVVSLHNRNMLLLTGGDRLVELLLLTSLFTDLGATWSVDSRRRPRAPFAPGLGLRFMQLELALLYLLTARLKLRGAWRTGNGVWISLQHDGFQRPLGRLLLRFPKLCKAMNYGVMGMEGAFGFLAFSPVARRITVPLAILCALGVQVGILTTMKVGTFTWVMIWTNALFVEPAWLDWLARRREPVVAPPPLPAKLGTRQVVAAAVLTFMVGLVAWPFLIGSHVKMPAPLRLVHRGASLEQLFELFGVKYDVTRWEGTGVGKDGLSVDVLTSTAPGLNLRAGWLYDPWYKLTFAEDQLDRPALGAWMCRRYSEKSGVALQSLTLTRHARSPSFIGEPLAPETTTQIWSGPCPQVVTARE